MGWCSGTEIFDNVVSGFICSGEVNTKEIIINLIGALENGDWDCQQDSEYWDHPLVQECFKELHPHWFEDDI